jgi:hypothetical protein
MVKRNWALLSALVSFLNAGSAPAAESLPSLLTLSSAQWRQSCGAHPLTQRLARHSPLSSWRLTVHYTDSKKNLKRPLSEKLCGLFRYSTAVTEKNKRELWGDIPYHFYVAADGHAAETRNIIYKPDSNTDYDRNGHIALVLEGNARDGITPAQKKKLFSLLSALQKKYRIPAARIGTHKDFAETNCPGPAIQAVVHEFKAHGGDRCERVMCPPARKPRCGWNEKLMNIAKREGCCPVWHCERIAKPVTPRHEDEEPDYEEYGDD